MIRLGIDIGGSAIKAALVDIETGALVSAKIRVVNSLQTEPEMSAKGILKIISRLDYNGPVGIGFPGRLQQNVLLSAPNLHPQWRGKDLQEYFEHALDLPVAIRNDADAAALAELRGGDPALGIAHRAIFLTLGTGIGSALFLDGKMWKDTELGHLIVGEQIAERLASAAVKNRDNLSWQDWGKRLNAVLQTYDFLFSPELFVLGGAISAHLAEFISYLDFPEGKIIPARLGNDAGIIGAAIATEDLGSKI